MLAQFVHRSLRYEEDILDAFTGILTRMEDKEFGAGGIGEKNLWGLPSKQFGAALQWTTNLPWPSTERVGFPSWSWASWIHTNDYVPPRNGSFHDIYEGFDDQGSDISVLTCYTVHGGKHKPVEKGNFERMLLNFNEEAPRWQQSIGPAGIAHLEMELRRHFAPQPPNVLETYIAHPSHSKQYLSKHIFLWTSCATLNVDRPPAARPRPATLDFPIRLKNGHQIGSIRLKPEWRETQLNEMHFFVSTTGLHVPSGPSPYPLQLKFKVILTELCYNESETFLCVVKRKNWPF